MIRRRIKRKGRYSCDKLVFITWLDEVEVVRLKLNLCSCIQLSCLSEQQNWKDLFKCVCLVFRNTSLTPFLKVKTDGNSKASTCKPSKSVKILLLWFLSNKMIEWKIIRNLQWTWLAEWMRAQCTRAQCKYKLQENYIKCICVWLKLKYATETLRRVLLYLSKSMSVVVMVVLVFAFTFMF